MKDEILNKIKEIEVDNNIEIIFAIESGSRAWGFESSDSDYDVRFVYNRKVEDYLKLKPLKDTLDFPINDLLDFHRWDLKKALLLMSNSNPSFYEWINSPIVYKTSDDFDGLKKLSLEYFEPSTAIHHYLRMAVGDIGSQDSISVKKYLYFIRGVLCADYILKHNKPAPVLFRNLLKELDDDVFLKEVYDLLDLKENSLEQDTVNKNKVIETYCESLIKNIEEKLPSLEKSIHDLKNCDEFFLGTVYE